MTKEEQWIKESIENYIFAYTGKRAKISDADAQHFTASVMSYLNLCTPSLPSNLDEAAEGYVQTLCDRADDNLRIDTTLQSAFKAGAEWREAQIPVPSDMMDAADEYSATPDNKRPVDGEKYKAFVVGAEWMAGQGVKYDGIVRDNGFVDFDEYGSSIMIPSNASCFNNGDKVVVQIRKI